MKKIILISILILLTFCHKEDNSPYDIKTIHKGSIRVNEPPHILKNKDTYSWAYLVTEDIYKVNTSSGYAKLCGICYDQPHDNSYRFVFKVSENVLQLGYYSYVGNVSPQEDSSLKGLFDVEVKIGDMVYMTIALDEVVSYTIQVNDAVNTITQPLPTGFNFVVIECNPNINVKAQEELQFYFSY